jgi:AAA family ATPase
MYVGESERAIREVFRKARSAAPSVIFFDEIDAIAASRGTGASATSGLNVLTTLLNEMDGIESLRGVLVLAATNKPEVLDPALMRPGRFDARMYVGPPTLAARIEIFRIRTRNMPLAEDVDFESLADRTDGYSGAEIVRICNEAAEQTADEGENDSSGAEGSIRISQRHFDAALQKVPKLINPEMLQAYEAFRQGGVTDL